VDQFELILAAAVACEMALLFFLFCIARFYELKFKESTYHVSFLIPVLVLVAMLAAGVIAGFGLETELLFAGFCTLLVLMTTGLFLYRKMMGVSP